MAMADVVMADTVATRLELVQALRLATTPAAKKIDLVTRFIESSKSSDGDATKREEPTSAWIKMPQVIGFLSEWVQSALIRSCKPGASSSRSDDKGDAPHLDSRYWSILSFCLHSGYLPPLSGVSPSLMRPLTSCISASLSSPLKLQLIEVASLLFTEYSRPFRSNLESWVSLTSQALHLLRPDGGSVFVEDSSTVALVSAVVEGFSRTIASHPNPNKVFQSVVARLLEPLLAVIGDSTRNEKQSLSRVVRAAEEIVENGVFHPSHVGGFLEVCVFLKGTNVRADGDNENANAKKNSEARQRSYHRTFFQKVEELRMGGNSLVLVGLGRTFRIYARRWKAQQVALSEDVYGVRGHGKTQLSDSSMPGEKAERGGESKSGDKGGHDVDAEKEEAVPLPPRKQANQTDALFTVFAELVGPLTSELSTLVTSETASAAESQTLRIPLLLQAINELLSAAKESGAYKSLEDTLSSTYFNFLLSVHDVAIRIGARAFEMWSNGDPEVPVSKKRKKRSEGAESARGSSEIKRSEDVCSEVVFGLQNLLELEYRVFEQQLESVWVFLFQTLAPVVARQRTVLKGLEFGCGLINMYSDLRQVEVPIFHLTDTLIDLQTSSHLPVLSVAVEKIICTPQYLLTLGSVIHKLPEGQVASLLRALQAAVTKTLDSFNTLEAKNSVFRGPTKGLLEVYTSILENANATSSNSVLAGNAVKELLMKVLAPPMRNLVDACTPNEDELSTDNADVDFTDTKSLLLLSVYKSSQALHRQCLSLMPPKAARKARTAVFEKEIDVVTSDEADVVAYLKTSGFLASLQRGDVKMSKFLTGVLQNGRDSGAAMIYTVHGAAVQSLVELGRRVWALKFLSGRTEAKKKYAKVLRSLEKEGAKLVSIVLKNFTPNENENASVIGVQWNRVLTTLDSVTIHVARWRLVCETVDVWSTFATEDHLRGFVMVLLRTGKARSLALEAPKKLSYSEADAGYMGNVDLDSITEDILTRLEFYEIEGIRKVFSSAFLEELKRTLLSSFKEDCAILSIVDDCIQGATPPYVAESNAVFVEKVKRRMRSADKLSGSTRKELVLSEEQIQTFSDCSRLLNLLASLPCGYLPPADNARCAYTICQLEIFFVNFFFGDKAVVQLPIPATNSPSDGSRLIWADAIIACRRALDSLAKSSATSEPKTVSSDFTTTLFGTSTSAECVTLLPEIVAVRTLQSFTTRDGGDPASSSSLFHAVLNETCGVIEASFANICSAEAKALVSTKASLGVPPLSEKANSKKAKKSKKVKGALSALSALGAILIAEAQNLEKLLQIETSPNWQRQIATVAAISSTLWSMTTALEAVDKECRNSGPSSLVWRAELPPAWFQIIKELEPVLVRILLHVLFPAGAAAGLAFFSKAGTATEADQDPDNDLEGEEAGMNLEDEDLVRSNLSSGEESEEEDTDVGEPDDDDHDAEAVNTDHTLHAMEESSSSSPSPQFASLRSLLEGNVQQKPEFVGELYMAVSAIVKLRSLFYSPFSSTTDVSESTAVVRFKDEPPLLLDPLLLAAYRLLSGSVPLIQAQKLRNPGWLVGIIQYVGAVGCYVPCMKPFISPTDFAKLANLHLELLGALVVLKENLRTGTEAHPLVLTPRETSDWDLDVHDLGRSGRAGNGDRTDALLFLAQRSFESLLKYAPRQHMVLALQSVEKAVAGVWGGGHQGVGFRSGTGRGFQVVPVVAAGVDCLGLALQAVSGKMRLHLLASHCPAFYGGVFNLIAHCQGPSLFLERRPVSEGSLVNAGMMVDGAPVVLRGLGILITLAARAVIFPMKACFVAMALQCPGTLFRSFYDVGNSKALMPWKHGIQDIKAASVKAPVQGFNDMSVKLYVACCRLLCALLRHRIRECGHSMALLGESCRILLHCLAAPSWTDTADSSLASAAQCAGWLSRVYQEMEAHKESMGKYCCHLLADYLNVISGHSLGGVGLMREVDNALRPGAFALLDASSGNDLQQLHAALGEGARRSALMTLRHDYDLHYKYTGKV